MGHDHQESSSSGAVIAIVVAVMLVAIVGLLAVAGAGLFWVRTARVESLTAVVAEQRAIAELHQAEAEARLAVAQAKSEEAFIQLKQSRVAATPGPRLNFEVTLDRKGNASVDGEVIDLDELKARLAKLKDDTGNAFSVLINADPECPVKHVISVADMLKDAGGIDCQIKSSKNSHVLSDEVDVEN